MKPKELVQAWVEAFNQGDSERLSRFYAESSVNHQVAQAPVQGRVAIREMFRQGFADAKMTCIVENIFEEGDCAILEWRDPSGLRGCGFFWIKDDQITFQRGYWDKLTFLRLQGSWPKKAHLIFYVADQKASSLFYSRVLALKPQLDVPGMTEFALGEGTILGLMPQAGIKRLLGDKLPDPAQAAGVPRAELYLLTEDPAAFHRRALENGAQELSPLCPRDWGHEAAYSLDPDAHVLAFAKAA